MGDLLRILEGVEMGVEVDDFPWAMYQTSLEKTVQQTGREQAETQEEAIEQERHGQSDPQNGNNRTEETDGQRQTRPQDHGDEETQRNRQFPQSPRPRRPNPDSHAYGGGMSSTR
jgi:hypothetical protein